MRRSYLLPTLATFALAAAVASTPAMADSAKPGATSAVMGESLSARNGQVVFHIPITAKAPTLKHAGSVLVLFNTTNDEQVQLVNPVIDVAKGVVRATVPGASAKNVAVCTIPNAKQLKPVVKTVDGVKTTTYTGAQLAIGKGIASVLTSELGLPAEALSDGATFGTADITLGS